MSDQTIFSALPGGSRIWAVAAIHGEAERAAALHDRMGPQMQPGDRLVYLGNYYGRGAAVGPTIDEILVFRRRVMASFGNDGDAVVYLRGAQEEMWQKLLQLQFAPNPAQVLEWMLSQGVGATIAAYGGDPRDGFAAAKEGILALTRWTSGLRQAMRNHDGHMALMAALRHAAYGEDQQFLFVHAGVDPSRPLSAQADSFWWGSSGFSGLAEPYADFGLVVRGYDPRHGGFAIGQHSATIDAGCGFGGPLVAACFGPDGGLLQVLEG
jgi:serine/threonine protein phosphatase 1